MSRLLLSLSLSLSSHLSSSLPLLTPRLSKGNIKEINLLTILVETCFTQILVCIYSVPVSKAEGQIPLPLVVSCISAKELRIS